MDHYIGTNLAWQAGIGVVEPIENRAGTIREVDEGDRGSAGGRRGCEEGQNNPVRGEKVIPMGQRIRVVGKEKQWGEK